MKLVVAVASHLSTSASVTTTTESARIELESSSPWLVVLVVGKLLVVMVGKLVMVGKMGKVGKGMLRLCFLLGSSDHSCNTNAGATWGTAT